MLQWLVRNILPFPITLKTADSDIVVCVWPVYPAFDWVKNILKREKSSFIKHSMDCVWNS